MGVRRLFVAVFVSIGVTAGAGLWAPLSFGLPPGRHFEMVSPQFKGGYGITAIEGVDPTGEGAAYRSLGAFAGTPGDQIGSRGNGNTYVSHRGLSEWSTAGLMVPSSVAPYAAPGLVELSSDFTSALFEAYPGSSVGAGQFESTKREFFTHPTYAPDTPSGFAIAGSPITVPPRTDVANEDASHDLSHIILEGYPSTPPLTPEAEAYTGGGEVLYDMVASGSGAPSLHMFAVDNQAEPKPISPTCEKTAGQLGSVLSGNPVPGSNSTGYNAVSADGQIIFFHADPSCTGRTEEPQLFARLNDERTIEVSRSLEEGPCVGMTSEVPGEVPCKRPSSPPPPAEFEGASEDGSTVYFVTTAKLVSEDAGTESDLYVAHIGCPESEPGCPVSHEIVTRLADVTRSRGSSEGPGLQGPVAVSPDGSRVYFVARGVLSGANAEGHSPIAKADNLYVYNDAAGGSVAFVAELCSDNSESGEVTDDHCPVNNWIPPGGVLSHTNDENLWASSAPPAQVTKDGKFLLFASFAQLTPDDSDNAIDVYRYDAETGTLARVSVGENGFDANGNGWNEKDEAANAGFPHFPGVSEPGVTAQVLLGARSMTEDGSRVVFSTAEPLSPAATNGLLNGYEWHEGLVSLVSTGSDPLAVGQLERMTITPSGSDIFFTTAASLLPQDTDEAADLYDVRFGSGFPEQPRSDQRCGGDACQGALTNPAALLVPGSVSQQPGENVASPVTAHAKSRAVKRSHTGHNRHRRKRVKRHRHTSKTAHKRGA